MKLFIGVGLALLLVTVSVRMTASQEFAAQQSGRGEAVQDSAASVVENAVDTLRPSDSSSSERICVLGKDGMRCDKPLTLRGKSVESSADAVDTTNQNDPCVKKILTENGNVVCQP